MSKENTYCFKIIMNKSEYDFGHATTAHLLWHLQICHLIESSISETPEINSQDFNNKLINIFLNGSHPQLDIVDPWSTGIPPAQLQKFEWPVWPQPFTYWLGNGTWHLISWWIVFVTYINMIHKIAMLQLKNLEDIGQVQRSLHMTHPFMLMIISAK